MSAVAGTGRSSLATCTSHPHRARLTALRAAPSAPSMITWTTQEVLATRVAVDERIAGQESRPFWQVVIHQS
jgi:hypothetical protein